MGADMLLASVRDNYGRTFDELSEIIDALTPARAANIFHAVENENYEDLYEDGDPTELEFVQDKLSKAVEAIRLGSREVTYLEFPVEHTTVIIWMTGGMSWGDYPTEVFEPFIYLAEAAIL